jgi:hypothetical protein
MKQGTGGWAGVASYSSDTRTCDLELVRGHATVKCGKYFEVRYFLNIAVSTSHSKAITVQLPIVLIHMNSLDVVAKFCSTSCRCDRRETRQHPSQTQPEQTASARYTNYETATAPSTSGSPTKLTRRPSSAAAHKNQTYNVQGRAFAAPPANNH